MYSSNPTVHTETEEETLQGKDIAQVKKKFKKLFAHYFHLSFSLMIHAFMYEVKVSYTL